MKRTIIVLIVLAAVLFTACHTHTHVVGRGAQTGATETQSQWYILFGLVPINNVDTNTMARGAEDYTIITSKTFLDSIISGFTSCISVDRRTVKVER